MPLEGKANPYRVLRMIVSVILSDREWGTYLAHDKKQFFASSHGVKTASGHELVNDRCGSLASGKLQVLVLLA